MTSEEIRRQRRDVPDVAADVVDGAGSVPPNGLRHATRAFRSRDFAIFWWALASNTGTWVQNLAVPFVLYELTSSALWVGLATFDQFGPSMLLGPLAGSIADGSIGAECCS